MKNRNIATLVHLAEMLGKTEEDREHIIEDMNRLSEEVYDLRERFGR